MTRYEDLAGELTLAELAALTSGTDTWRTTALPTRGVPALKTADGPSGVRGESYTSTTSASFPCGTALAATFDPALVAAVAGAIADEAATKRAHVVLGPTLNLVRHPLAGRNFETYGEDPILAGLVGAAYVRGVQGRGVGACVKHFVANDAEIERLTVSSDVGERVLREVYLRPFEAAVREGGAWCVMASYNRVDGVYVCEHHWLLTEVLRGDWGFDGLVVSDWFATHDTVASAGAGLDLEMPGPPRHLGPALATAAEAGDVPVERVAAAARHVLRTLDRVGAHPDDDGPEASVDDPDRWVLATAAAAAVTVLLRNEWVDGTPLLPLDPSTVRRVAVLGPNAAVAAVQGGGSAQVTPHRTVSPLAGLRARLGAGVEVVTAPGCARGEHLPVLDGGLAATADGPGIRLEYSATPGGPVVAVDRVGRLAPIWSGRFAPDVDPERFHVRAVTTLTPPVAGRHTFGVVSIGPCVVRLDGDVLLDNRDPVRGEAFFGYGSTEVRSERDLDTGRGYELVVEYDRPPGEPMGALRLGVQPPLGSDPIGDAVALAAAADVAIVVVGTDEEVETEARDRTTFSLTGRQDELVRRVAAANPRTVVVVNAGGPVDLPWAEEVPAVVWSWFGGMALGEALAAVLVGDVDPGGRLPFTVPVHVDDAPCRIDRSDPPGHLRYTEGLSVGYRSYLDRGVTPRYWFGHGTGYASATWGRPRVARTAPTGAPLTVEVDVALAAGVRAAVEVVQVYARRPRSTVTRPAWVFAGCRKVVVAPRETQRVVVVVEPAALRHWDEDDSAWVVEPGPLELRVARHAGDPGTVVAVDLLPRG